MYAIGVGDYGITGLSSVIINILVTLLYAAICWQLIVKSKSIAEFIYDKTNLGTSFKVISRPNDLLYILFIIIGFYYLLENLPMLVKAVVTVFKSKAVSKFDTYDQYEKPADWTILIIRLLLPCILLIAARPIANYFAKNVSDEPITIGEDIGNTNDDNLTEV